MWVAMTLLLALAMFAGGVALCLYLFACVLQAWFRIGHSWVTRGPCCMDPAGGAAGRAGVAGRPLTCRPDAQRALQAEPGPPPPYSPAEAQGNELARVRRWPPPARELDGLVHR